jgi:hypothetical protein
MMHIGASEGLSPAVLAEHTLVGKALVRLSEEPDDERKLEAARSVIQEHQAWSKLYLLCFG